MGTLDFLMGSGHGPTLQPPPSSTGFSYPSSPNATPTKGAPERFNLNQTFNDLSQGGAGLFGELGQLPSRVYESPVSLLDVTAQRTLGFSPMDAIGKTPVGGVAGFLGEAFQRSSNFVPALINSTDANIWKVVGDLPDNTEITDELVRTRLQGMGESSLFAEGEKTEGVPVLGSLPFLRHIFGGRAKTVGELKAELGQRGFFYDTEGNPLDPTQVAQDLRDGKRSTFDFGDRSINDNALVDLAGRVALDPTNALFFVPGAGLAKIGSLVGKLLPASRLIRAGAIADKAPSALTAAVAIQKGNRAGATLAGMSRVMSGYRKLAIGTTVGNFAINRLSEAISDPEDQSFVSEIAEFTKAVEDRKPMSGNAAFMLFSAATFPYGHYVKQAKAAQKGARARVFGVADMDSFHREYKSRSAFYDEFGGKPGEAQLADFLDKQIARDQRRLTPKEVVNIQSIADVSLRRRIEQQALERIVDRMRSKGEITSDMRLAKFKEWHSGQAGFEKTGVANPWDATRAARRWRNFEPVRQAVDPILRDTGEVIWGLRDDVVFTEQVDAARDVLRNARYKDADGKTRVDTKAILDVLEDHPNINSLDRTGFWARFGDKNAPAPTYDALSRRLGRLRRDSIKVEDYTKDLAIWEQGAPKEAPAPEPLFNRQERIEQLRAQLDETTDQNGTIHPERVEESQAIQRELESALAEENGVHWAKMGEQDAKAGLEKGLSETVEKGTDPFLQPVHLSPGLERLPQDVVQRVVDLEKEVLQINPSYRVKRAPLKDVLALVPEDGAIRTGLRQHTALGEWVHQAGPLSSVSRMWHALTRRLPADELATDAKNSLRAELATFGVKGSEMNNLLKTLEQRVQDSELLTIGSFKVRYYRDIGAITPGEVNRIARRVLSAKAIERMDAKGGFYRVMARTSSRYWRTLDVKARSGDKGAAALRGIYRVWNDAPVFSKMATTQRTVARMVYPLFRFALDPRWLGLNAIEANILTTSKHGVRKGYESMGQASNAAHFFTHGKDMGAISPEVGYSLTRELTLLTAKTFDKASGESVAKVLNELGNTDPAIKALRINMLREAEDGLALAERQFKAGDITERTYRAEQTKAQRAARASTQDLAAHLNDTLYRYEKQGVEATVLEEAKAILNTDDMRVMAPLIERVADVNRKTWDDLQTMIHGNPSRSTIERLMNSWWLYWPISYQIKATKWLADIMLNGSFGHDNGALLAGKYALWQDQHKKNALHNPAYAALYAAQPSLWFAAQMLLPMSPEDIGVSLSRVSRLAGTQGQRFLNGWLGTDIGVFTADKYLDDPSAAVDWMTTMGLLYTSELSQRILNESNWFENKPQATQPALTAPIPSTAGGQTSVPVR